MTRRVFPNKGDKSVGVARQYCGTLGKTGNCQVAVSMHLATSFGSFPLDFELYLPEVWARDPERCRQARVPEDRMECKAKWELALEMTDRALSWGARSPHRRRRFGLWLGHRIPGGTRRAQLAIRGRHPV